MEPAAHPTRFGLTLSRLFYFDTFSQKELSDA